MRDICVDKTYFDQQEIDVLTDAHTKACDKLSLSGSDQEERLLLAHIVFIYARSEGALEDDLVDCSVSAYQRLRVPSFGPA